MGVDSDFVTAFCLTLIELHAHSTHLALTSKITPTNLHVTIQRRHKRTGNKAELSLYFFSLSKTRLLGRCGGDCD